MSVAKAKAPAVELGDVVLWYPDGDVRLTPCPAIVTGLGGRLALNIASNDNAAFRVRDGVPHVSDPDLAREFLAEVGAWDATPRLKRLIELETVAC